tara:strand:+ start:872 stop:1450 length:579 start_codon:yes stop_codon:yes gene_type:complete
MKKRTAIIGALVSLLPMGQPLVIGTGAAFISSAVILSAPEKAKAESAVFYYNRGVDKSNAGDYYGAISDYNKAIEINPRYADAYYNRGLAKRKSGDNYGAISDYSKAIEITPMNESAYYNRGNVKGRDLKDYYGAISDFSKVIEINPRNANAYGNRGLAKKFIGDMEGACSDWRKSASMGKANAAQWVRNQC